MKNDSSRLYRALLTRFTPKGGAISVELARAEHGFEDALARGRAYAEAGADIITFHLEATTHAERLLSSVRAMGAKAGISICPQTPVAMLEDLAGDFDLALVMSVNPGFGGQRFIPHALEKVRETRELRERSGAKFEIEVDGGITLENARAVAEAGADVLVVGSAIFDTPDCGRTTKQFAELLGGAASH